MKKISAVFAAAFLISSCASGPGAVQTPETVPQVPGWEKVSLETEVPATRWREGKLVFSYPRGAGIASVEVLSPRWNQPLPLDTLENTFQAAVVLPEPESFEYAFSVTRSDGVKERKLDPGNRAVVWKKPLWSVFHQPDTPLPVLWYFEEKRYLVMVPAGYYSQPEERYPVMYWHDGQNMPSGPKSPFGGWKADTVLAGLVASGEARPIIQVGIFNSPERMAEYTAWTWPVPEDLKGEFAVTEAQRDKSLALADLIVKKIIPEVEAGFRTLPGRENRGIGGSSAGAMMALYMAFSRPEIFGKVAAVAGGEAPYRALRERWFSKDLNLRIYLDCGTEGIDRELLPETEKLGAFLMDQGYAQGSSLFYRIFQGDPHNEQAWAKRLPGILKFLFPKEAK